MKLTADILNRFAQARELDQRAKEIAAERGEIVTTEMYKLAIDGTGTDGDGLGVQMGTDGR